MSSQDKWNLAKPKLILSITGSNKKLNLSSKTKKLIKRGLTKVCESTRSLIITDGSDIGVSKMIGDGLAESHRFAEFVTIGIISLNRVANSNELINATAATNQQDNDQLRMAYKSKTYYGVKEEPLNQNIRFLDHNHSHFVLVDTDDSETNGSGEQQQTAEDDLLERGVLFRVKLEREMRNGWSSSRPRFDRVTSRIVEATVIAPSVPAEDKHSLSSFGSDKMTDYSTTTTIQTIPSILICINGQFESLLLVKESLREKVSVLILAVITKFFK